MNIASQQIVHLLNPVISLFTCDQLVVILLSLIEVELKLLQPVNLFSVGLEYALVDQARDGLVALVAADLVVEPEPERLSETGLDGLQYEGVLAPVARPPDQVLVQVDDCLHLTPDLDCAQLRVQTQVDFHPRAAEDPALDQHLAEAVILDNYSWFRSFKNKFQVLDRFHVEFVFLFKRHAGKS